MILYATYLSLMERLVNNPTMPGSRWWSYEGMKGGREVEREREGRRRVRREKIGGEGGEGGRGG